VDAKCVGYFGPNLTCSTIATNDSLELILQKLEDKICVVAADYSTYNIHCLTGPIITEAGFVSAITAYACATNTALVTFTGTTFPTYQSTVNTRFHAIEVPGLTCSNTGAVPTDTLQVVLQKFCTEIAQIDDELNIDGVEWDQCFTVTTPPTNIPSGFGLILDQICQVKALIGDASLPTFNNVGSCLASPGAADSLVDTITKIKTRLCQTGAITVNTLTSSCVTIPSSPQDLQTLLQNMLTKVDVALKALPTFDSGDFTVTNVSDGNLCLGKNVALASSLNADRYVASNDADTDPGTLFDKLQAGTGITLGYGTPGKVIITGSGTTDDHKVLADTVDDTPGYLDQKLEGMNGTSGISVDTSYNTTTKRVEITPSIDMQDFFSSLVSFLNANPDQKTVLCELIANCPSPCAQPQNVSAVYISGGGTTTTTTTTTP